MVTMLGKYLIKAAQLGKAGCTKDLLLHDTSGAEVTRAVGAALLNADLVTTSGLRRRNYAMGFTLPAPKELSSILKIDTVRDASKEEIARIWNEVSTGTIFEKRES